MIRLSVTDVDAIMAWMDSEQDLDVLLRRLRREEPPTEAMKAGRAFHSVMEHATEDLTTAERDGYKFRFCLNSEIALPPIKELKGEMEVTTSVGPVTLVGVVDGMQGRIVTDYKLTSYFDAERYMNSFQWKAYLMMFKANKFNYEVFTAKAPDIRDREEGLGEYLIMSHDTLPLCRYESLNQDVLREINHAAQFIAKYLPEKIQDQPIAVNQ